MRNHHDYPKKYIGCSDIASLIFVGIRPDEEETPELDHLKTLPLHFGGDRGYSAYTVDADAEIPLHYVLVASFKHWLKVYDDDSLVAKLSADRINVYRAGEYGCIIQLIDANRDPAALEYHAECCRSSTITEWSIRASLKPER